MVKYLKIVVMNMTKPKPKLEPWEESIIKESKFNRFINIFYKTILIIVALILTVVFVSIFIKLEDLKSKIIFLPFIICGLLVVGIIFAVVQGKEKIQVILGKLYILVFIIFWFVAIIAWSIQVIKEGASISFLLMILPFLLIGIYMVYEFIKKLRK